MKRLKSKPKQNSELSVNIIQGLIITIGTLFCYQFAIYQGFNDQKTRTMVFVALVTANIFLTLVNRSFYYLIFTTVKYKINLVPIIVGITIFITGLLLFLDPMTKFFAFEQLNGIQLLFATGLAAASVLWYELIKVWKRNYAGK